jgi:nucleoside-triphosphatase
MTVSHATNNHESRMQRLVRFCWANLDTIVSILLAVTAVWFSLVGAKTDLAIAATATILAFVAFGLMRDRGARGKLILEIRGMHDLIHGLQRAPAPDVFFAERLSEKDFLVRADKELLLIQETGRLMAETCRRELVTFLERGGRLRWICTLDDAHVVQMMALRNKNLSQDRLIADRMAEGAKMIEVLAGEARGFAANMEVRFLPYPPDITAVFLDPQHSDQGRREALVRLQGFQITFEDKINFKINSRWSPHVFELYRSQGEAMWKSSTKCIFLTGRPRIGKSTLLAEVVEALKTSQLNVVGFLTRDVRDQAGDRIGFDTATLDGSRSGQLARKGPDGEYKIDSTTMENVVMSTLTDALANPPDLLVIDEIGPIQLKHAGFQTLIEKILDNRRMSLLGIVALTGNTYLSHVQQFYRTGIREVNESNRGDLKSGLVEEFVPRNSR